MRKIILLTFGLLLYLSSYSQQNILSVERNISEFNVDTTSYRQLDFNYSNNSDSTYILWIEKDNVESLSNYQKIRKHFFTVKGDFALIQLLWDGNVGSFTPELFDGFIKTIKPKEQFSVSVLKRGKTMTNLDLTNLIEKHIIIVKATEIKGLEINSSIDMFIYKAKSVTLLAEWLTKK